MCGLAGEEEMTDYACKATRFVDKSSVPTWAASDAENGLGHMGSNSVSNSLWLCGLREATGALCTSYYSWLM